MNNLKLIILSFASALLFSVSTYAETLKIILPADASGSYNTRFQILKGEIESTGKKVGLDKVEFVWGDNCARGASLVNNEKGPMITVWDANFNLSEDCRFDLSKKNVIAVENNYIRFCAPPGSNITAESFRAPGSSLKVGHSTPHSAYQKWFEGFNKASGTNLIPVPYGSSGKVRRGALAGDIDMVFISPSNSNKLMKAGGTCFYSTGPDGESKYGMPALKSVTSFDKAAINMSNFYAVKNMSKKQIKAFRQMFDDIAQGKSSEFTKWTGTKDIYLVGTISTMSTKEMIAFIDESIANWK